MLMNCNAEASLSTQHIQRVHSTPNLNEVALLNMFLKPGKMGAIIHFLYINVQKYTIIKKRYVYLSSFLELMLCIRILGVLFLRILGCQ